MKRCLSVLCFLFVSFAVFASSEEGIVLNCTNTKATVYLNGEVVGTTPYVVEDYSFPLTVLFRAEGFTDRIITLTDYVPEKNVELFTVEIDRNESFKKTRNQFYWSFARSLALVGINAAARSFFEKGTTKYKTTNIVMQSLIGVSVAETGYRLYRYYKSAKNLVY